MANGDKKGGLIVARDYYFTGNTTETIHTFTMTPNSICRVVVEFVGQRLNNASGISFTSITTINATTTTASVRTGPTDVNIQGSDVTSAITTSGLDVNVRAVVASGAPWRIAAWIYIYELEQQYLAI